VADDWCIQRIARRDLLLASIGGMTVTSALLAYGLNTHHNILSACCIILFIVSILRLIVFSILTCQVSFALGLGPIPFLLISEMVPPPGIPALSSLSLSLNWLAAFIVAITFLPLRDALSSPSDPRDPLSGRFGEGRVFYVFTGVGVVLGGLVWRGFAR
jgi:SP family facilitated glucose transporter-like MFS transporter 3